MLKYKYKCYLTRIVLLFFCIISISKIASATPVVISNIEEFYDPIPYNDGNITIAVTITRVDAPESSVILFIDSPVKENISWIKSEFIDSQTNKYYFTYNPSQIGTYFYYIEAVNTNNETTISPLYSFESAVFPYIESISYNTSVKWDNGSVEFYVWVRKWTSNISFVVINISSPESVNISLTKLLEDGNLSLWYGSFDPSLKSLYQNGEFSPLYYFNVIAADVSGNISVSSTFTFISESYYPVVVSSFVFPKGILSVGENISIYAVIEDDTNATYTSSNVNLTQLLLLSPDLSLKVYNMTPLNETHYVVNISLMLEGDYFYKIKVMDEEGNIAESRYYALSTSPSTYDTVNISVKVAPSCQAVIFLLPDEDKLLVNTTVIWLSILENLGNVPLNETTNISIEKDTINPGEEKFVLLPPNIIAFARDEEEEVEPLDDTFFFLIWFTHNLPLGNYTAKTYSTYRANVSTEDGYFTCNGTVNDTVHFELVDAIGESRPSPILVIREMPEQIFQDPDCITSSDRCIKTKVRLVLFNRGDKVAYNISIKDSIRLYDCSSAFSDLCENISLECVSSNAYSCAVTTNKSSGEIGGVSFNVSEPLSPRDYVILEYYLTPPPSMLVYNGSAYKFEARGRHIYGDASTTYVIYENDPYYNKEEYKMLFLRALPSFMFDLVVLSSNTTEKRRTFSANKVEEFLISSEYISSISTSSWYINFTFPEVFTLSSCEFVEGVSCSCGVDNTTNTVICKGSSPLSKGSSVKFKVNALSKIYSEYVLPGFFNDYTYNASEDFLPGLFILSIPKIEIKVPVPKPVPVPTPVPEPKPEPRTGPEINQEHLPKVEIVIRPLNESYVVYQGDTFPTFFEIENIGNATATNISIEAILPSSLWDQSKAYINTLSPGEKVNRTLMLSLSEDVAPGIYVIPVKAMVKDAVGDITYITIKVLFAKKLAKMRILEVAQEIEIQEGSNLTVPILIKNIGKKILHNVTVRIENVEECIESFKSSKEVININESKTIFLHMRAKNIKSQECKAILIASSDEQAYDFVPVVIRIYPKPPLLPLREHLTPLISLLWTFIFVLYAVIRKRKAMRGERPKSKIPRLILYLLMFGELLIIIYLVLWMVGVVRLL